MREMQSMALHKSTKKEAQDMSNDDKFHLIAGGGVILGILAFSLGIGAEVAWSNHDTNIRYNKCETVAAQNHMHANCPAHLISPDPITWPSQENA